MSETEAEFDEECLSVPGFAERVRRPDRVVLQYRVRDFQDREIKCAGSLASALHLDHLSPLRRRLLGRRLRQIAGSEWNAPYPMQIGDPPAGRS